MIEERHTQSHPTDDTLNQLFTFHIEPIQIPLYCITITINAQLIDTFYNESARVQQASINAAGFGRGEVPIDYIREYYKEHLIGHLKEFLLKFCIINILYKEIRNQKLLIAGEPRLINIMVHPGQEAKFQFEVSLFPSFTIHEWKYFPFKAPKRKNYKDIDRQVDSLVKEECGHFEKYKQENITLNDWVCFNLTIVTEPQGALEHIKQKFWYHIGDEEVDSPLNEIFMHKKSGDTFITTNKELQEYFSNHLEINHVFQVEIVDTLPHSYFDFELFKRYFKIKTNKDMHKKLIEVFSYRNDVSQRRMMVEEAMKLILSKHRFSVPTSLILRQQKIILDLIQQNPDYNVYRMQKDFQKYVRQLAEKQARELLLTDQLAYHENTEVTTLDVKSYLNLSNRPRMKEFIYFDMPQFKLEGQEIPIPSETLKRLTLREKIVNYAIFYLTKQ